MRSIFRRWLATWLLASLILTALIGWMLRTIREPYSKAIPTEASLSTEAESEFSSLDPVEDRDVSGQSPSAMRAESSLEDTLGPLSLEEVRALARRRRAVFYGVVRDVDGRPCRDAELWYGGGLVAHSDHQGTYRIEIDHRPVAWLGSRPVHPALVARLCVQGGALEWTPPRSARIDFRLGREHVLSGRTFEARTRQVLAQVAVHGTITQQELALFDFEVTSSELGRFEVLGVPGGTWLELRAHTPVPRRDSFDLFNFVGTEGEELAVGLRPAVRIKGCIDPWPASLSPATLRVNGEKEWERGVTSVGEDGCFALESPIDSERVVLSVLHESRELWSQIIDLSQFPLDDVDLGSIALPSMGGVRGRVTLPAALLDSPLKISIVPFSSARGGEARIEPNRPFEVSPFPAGPALLLVAFHADTVLQKELSVGAEQFLDLGEVSLEDPLIIGRVIEADGNPPLRPVWVTGSYTAPSEGSQSGIQCSADELGFFVFRFGGFFPSLESGARRFNRPEEIEILANDAAGRSASRKLLFEQNGIQYLTLRLPEGLELSGRIEDENGRRLSDWMIFLDHHEREPELCDITAPDGSFFITNLCDRSYRVFVEPPPAALNARANQTQGVIELPARRPSSQPVVLVVGEWGR